MESIWIGAGDMLVMLGLKALLTLVRASRKQKTVRTNDHKTRMVVDTGRQHTRCSRAQPPLLHR